jgi:hypothetical protein
MELSTVKVGEVYAFIPDYANKRRQGHCSIDSREKPAYPFRVINKEKQEFEEMDSCGRKSPVRRTVLKGEVVYIPPNHMYAEALDVARKEKGIKVEDLVISAKDLVCPWENEVSRARDQAMRDRTYEQLVAFQNYLDVCLSEAVLRGLDLSGTRGLREPEWDFLGSGYEKSQIRHHVQTPEHSYTKGVGSSSERFMGIYLRGEWTIRGRNSLGDTIERTFKYRYHWEALPFLAARFKIKLPKAPKKYSLKERMRSVAFGLRPPTSEFQNYLSKVYEIDKQIAVQFSKLSWKKRVEIFVQAMNCTAKGVWADYPVLNTTVGAPPVFDVAADWGAATKEAVARRDAYAKGKIKLLNKK